MFSKRWMVEVTQNPATLWDQAAVNRWYRSGGRTAWPVVATRFCWTRSGAYLHAGRYAITPSVRVTVKDTKAIS